MSKTLRETIHKPLGSYPYMCFENRNFNYFLHFHEELEVLYVEDGQIDLLTEDDTVHLDTGDIAIVMPEEVHGLRSTAFNDLWVIKIDARSFTENVDLPQMRLEERRISPDDIRYELFARPILTMHSETTSGKNGYEFAVRACKNQLILALLRNFSFRKVIHPKNLSFLSEVTRYVETHYAEKITVDSAADACHLSKYYFLHEFKKHAGMTFGSYLSVFRLEKSLSLLRDGDLKIVDVAFQCGFGNVHSFNTAFKNYFNMTPHEYRGRWRKEGDRDEASAQNTFPG